MTTVRLTAKRQATLPKKLCEEMHVHSGDTLVVYPLLVNGERVWCFKPVVKTDPDWFGRLRKYAIGKQHGMDQIRKSIANAHNINLR